MKDSVLERPIYLDYQATTPTDPRVVDAMLPYLREKFGNPHSIQHTYGREAEAAVETARAQVAELLGADEREIIFTSGATESNNLAIKGVAAFQKGRRDHIVTAVTEHKCVLESCRRLEGEGWRVTYLPVGQDGLVDPAVVEAAVDDTTALVSIMAVNNEIGTIQPVDRIGEICRARGASFHSDAAQAVGKIPFDLSATKIDLLSLSGHKVYAPMGIGALFVRRRPRARLLPLFDGGGQERGLRSGTLAPHLCVGLGTACAIAKAEMDTENQRLAALSDRLRGRLEAGLDRFWINGSRDHRFVGNLNVSFQDIDAEELVRAIPGVALSTGSACTSASVEPSYVLQALGLGDDRARSGVRIGLGRFTTEAEIDQAAAEIIAAVTALRAASTAAQ